MISNSFMDLDLDSRSTGGGGGGGGQGSQYFFVSFHTKFSVDLRFLGLIILILIVSQPTAVQERKSGIGDFCRKCKPFNIGLCSNFYWPI